jgi:hypothetical protein
MAGTSRASELYHRIVGEPTASVALLEDMVKHGRPEGDFLEFKGASKASDKSIRENWSKALSAFANTEGGVVIWGIRAAPMSDPDDPSKKIDGAVGLDLAPNPRVLAQQLSELRAEANIEPVMGVEMATADAGWGDGSGFVVCLVPESRHKPHRAALHPDKQYYQRLGGKSVILPHPLLRHMFYPQLRSLLETKVQFIGRSPAQREVSFLGTLYNRGGASAINLYAQITTDPPLSRVGNGTYWTGIWNGRVAPSRYLFKTKTESTLHPGDDCSFFVGFSEEPVDRITFEISVYALNQEPQVMRVIFDKDDLVPDAVKTSTASVS